MQQLNNQGPVDSSKDLSCLTSSSESMQLWHNRLSHPNRRVLQTIMKTFPLLPNHTQPLKFCDVCQYDKLYQFHYSITKIKSKVPL